MFDLGRFAEQWKLVSFEVTEVTEVTVGMLRTMLFQHSRLMLQLFASGARMDLPLLVYQRPAHTSPNPEDDPPRPTSYSYFYSFLVLYSIYHSYFQVEARRRRSSASRRLAAAVPSTLARSAWQLIRS